MKSVDGFAPEENSPSKILWPSFSSKLDWVFYIVSVTKTTSEEIKP